jgi:hypothetical protein
MKTMRNAQIIVARSSEGWAERLYLGDTRLLVKPTAPVERP